MDRRDRLVQLLAQAERHIAAGEEHLTKQEALITEMVRRQHDTRGAIAVLDTLLEAQALHIQDRNRILKELRQPLWR